MSEGKFGGMPTTTKIEKPAPDFLEQRAEGGLEMASNKNYREQDTSQIRGFLGVQVNVSRERDVAAIKEKLMSEFNFPKDGVVVIQDGQIRFTTPAGDLQYVPINGNMPH